MRLNVRLSKRSTLFLVRLVVRLLTVFGAIRDAVAFVTLLWRCWRCVALGA